MAQTLVPQIVEYYRAAAVAAVAGQQPPVSVFLGEPTGGDIPASYVSVMYAGPERAAVVGQRVPQPSSEHWAEQFELWCSVSTSTGDENAVAQMADTDALYALVAAAFAADKYCGGRLIAPGFAEPGTYEWTVEQGGAVCTVFFTMRVSVRWGV